MRAIASLGCEGAMRAIASSVSPHVSPSRAECNCWEVAVHVRLLRERGYEPAPGELAAHAVVQDLGLQAR